jgi:hypothetical protein
MGRPLLRTLIKAVKIDPAVLLGSENPEEFLKSGIVDSFIRSRARQVIEEVRHTEFIQRRRDAKRFSQ